MGRDGDVPGVSRREYKRVLLSLEIGLQYFV